jgi:hypothetical protein
MRQLALNSELLIQNSKFIIQNNLNSNLYIFIDKAMFKTFLRVRNCLIL